MYLARFGGHEFGPAHIQALFLHVQRMSFRILPTVRYSCQACWSPEKFVNWVLYDALWLAQSSLRQGGDAAYPTSNRPCSSRCRLDDPQIQQGAPVQNRGVLEIGDMLGATGYIWNYLCSIIFRRYVSHLQSNYHHWARNRIRGGVFAWHLLIGMIRFRLCPVHARDVELSIYSFGG